MTHGLEYEKSVVTESSLGGQLLGNATVLVQAEYDGDQGGSELQMARSCQIWDISSISHSQHLLMD